MFRRKLSEHVSSQFQYQSATTNMESDSASRTASIAPNEDNSRASHLKRKRGQCDGHENHIDSRRTKPQRRGDDPQPRDNNVQFVDQISRSKPITFASTGHSNAPCEFHFSESEIKILKVIGHGYHSVVFRIAAGERTYALKVVSIRTFYEIS